MFTPYFVEVIKHEKRRRCRAGYCTLDYITLVNQYPEIDTKVEVMDFVEDGGGPTATALVTLARLGIRTRFIGKAATISGES